MKRKFTAALAAIALATTALAPVAEARDHHGRGDGYYDGRGHDGRGYDRHYRGGRDGRYYGRGGYYYRDRDRGDAAAAGVIGLVVGLALGSALSQDRAPPPGCRQQCPRGGGYYQQDPRYSDDSYYDDGGRSAYDEDYGAPSRQQCTRRERQWDRYANRYVTVDVPC